MKRTFIIAIVVVLVLAFGGGLVLLLANRSSLTSSKKNQNANRVVTTNAQNANRASQPIVRQDKGSIGLQKSVTYRGTTLEFTTVDSFDTFHGLSIKSGERFIVLFLKPVKGDNAEVQKWLISDAKLVAADKTEHSLRSLELVGTGSNVDTGFLAFTVPKDSQHFRLVLSAAGQSEASLDLGF